MGQLDAIYILQHRLLIFENNLFYKRGTSDRKKQTFFCQNKCQLLQKTMTK